MTNESNIKASNHWNENPVAGERSGEAPGSSQYYLDLKNHRYQYEVPFLPELFGFKSLSGKKVLEIGVGNGIDAGEIISSGSQYTGLDVTKKHLDLTETYIKQITGKDSIEPHQLLYGDLTEKNFDQKFDVVYSCGVLHHIEHEYDYLVKIRSLLNEGGSLRFAVYAKYSFFNFYMIFTWIVKNRCQVSLETWWSHLAERTDIDTPVTIKIRSKKEMQKMLEKAGFKVERYYKRGFVQKYIPIIGKKLNPDGPTLNFLGSLLGWYHIFWCRI